MTEPQKAEEKVTIMLQATGNAPILKKKKCAVQSTKTVAWVIQMLRKMIKMQDDESLFVYINQSFSPNLNRQIGNLYENFETNGKLILYYAKTPAWGWEQLTLCVTLTLILIAFFIWYIILEPLTVTVF